MSYEDIQEAPGRCYIIVGYNNGLHDILDYGGDFDYLHLGDGFDGDFHDTYVVDISMEKFDHCKEYIILRFSDTSLPDRIEGAKNISFIWSKKNLETCGKMRIFCGILDKEDTVKRASGRFWRAVKVLIEGQEAYDGSEG